MTGQPMKYIGHLHIFDVVDVIHWYLLLCRQLVVPTTTGLAPRFILETQMHCAGATPDTNSSGNTFPVAYWFSWWWS